MKYKNVKINVEIMIKRVYVSKLEDAVQVKLHNAI
jgi:hypothetical protein